MGFPIEIVGEGIDWPAWTQAAMSVVAIVAGFVALGIQRKQQNDDAAKAREQQLYDLGNARAEFISLANGLAKQARELVDDAERTAAAGAFQIEVWNFDNVSESMRALPMDRMPSAEFALAYVNVARALAAFGRAYEASMHMHDNGVPPTPELDESRSRSQRQVRLQYQRLLDEASAHGVDFVPHNTPTHEAIRAAKGLSGAG